MRRRREMYVFVIGREATSPLLLILFQIGRRSRESLAAEGADADTSLFPSLLLFLSFLFFFLSFFLRFCLACCLSLRLCWPRQRVARNLGSIPTSRHLQEYVRLYIYIYAQNYIQGSTYLHLNSKASTKTSQTQTKKDKRKQKGTKQKTGETRSCSSISSVAP